MQESEGREGCLEYDNFRIFQKKKPFCCKRNIKILLQKVVSHNKYKKQIIGNTVVGKNGRFGGAVAHTLAKDSTSSTFGNLARLID